MIGSKFRPSCYTILFFVAVAFTALLSSCDKVDCIGCYDDTPWSTPDNDNNNCYPTKDACEAAANTGQECVKCTD